MARQYVNPPGLSQPAGAIYTQVVRVGNIAYIAGQVGRDAQGAVAKGDIAAQYRQVIRNLQTAVESVGGTLNDIVKTTTFVVGAENIPALRAARQELRLPSPPTSAMIVVAALADPAFLVEVEAVAHIGE